MTTVVNSRNLSMFLSLVLIGVKEGRITPNSITEERKFDPEPIEVINFRTQMAYEKGIKQGKHNA